MEKKAKVPKLRFPGFAGDWEERKFSELYRKVNEKNDLTFGIEKTISVANMHFNKDVTITNAEYLKTYNIMRKGDIAFEGNKSKSFSHGRFVENTIGDGIVSHVFDVFRPKNDYDLFYWKYAINNEIVMGPILSKVTNSSTMMTNLVADDFLKAVIFTPAILEQRKIGNFFKSLDKLITLHQRKLTHLQAKKKSLLQKMFPKKGERVPEIRFPGFTDAWEQRKLGEIAECLDNMRIPINAEEREKIPGSIPYYGAGNIQGYIDKYLFDEELVLLLEDGDAFDDFRTKSIAQYVKGKSWINNHAHVLRPKGNGYFLFCILEHKDIRSATQLAGASRKKLVQSAMMNINVIMPLVSEQQKIGNFFKSLDNLITLHQRKLTHLQTQKKALLQQMFV